MKKTTIIYVAVSGFIGLSLLVLDASASKKQVEVVSYKENGRSALRAFYTAPPVIPHEVTDQQSNKECLYCHQDVLHIEGRTSVKTPHPKFSNCQQCHVQGKDMKISVKTFWQGLEEPQKGSRAFEGAPPTMPHRLFMRKNCLSCHGPDNSDKALRTSHPERVNCLQCHVAQKEVEF